MRWVASCLVVCGVVCGGVVGGCSTRTITVTSNPSGASVWLNDRAVGRTPVTVDFVYFGTYDVRVELDGHEPVHDAVLAAAPWWEWPGLDAASVLVPMEKTTAFAWHYDLVVSPADDPLLVNRAWAARWMAEEGGAGAGVGSGTGVDGPASTEDGGGDDAGAVGAGG